jgi:cell division protein FtsW
MVYRDRISEFVRKTKKEAGEFDPLLLLLPLVLTAFGIIMVYSASMPYAQTHMNDPYYFLKKQILWAVLGILCLLFLSRSDYTFFGKVSYPFMIACFILLALVFIPGIGRSVNGARRWIRIGSLNFQPSELAKLAVILSFSHMLVKKEGIVNDFRYAILPLLSILGAFFLLVVVQPDLGTAVVIAGIGLSLAFVAGVRIYYLFALGVLSVPGIIVFVSRHNYIQDRLRGFLNPWEDPLNTGFQAIQSFVAFGLGGWTGVGLGMGRQKQMYLPEPHTDFIFSVVGEEFGFLGCFAVLAVFALLIWRILRLMLSVKDRFALYLATGIGFMIAMESIVNVGVSLGFFPTKGLAFPFLSYGGSAMIVNLSAIGVLISVSRTART